MTLKIIFLCIMASVHLIASKLRFIHGVPRSIWLSIAGGASVAYVFLHLIPFLIHAHEDFTILGSELSVFIMALVGLSFIYGMENFAKNKNHGEKKGDVFWVHMISHSIYNFMIGYLLIHRNEQGNTALILFFVAMALHFLVDDYGLLQHHREQYLGYGRWIITAAVLAGGGLGLLTKVSDQIIYGAMGFISGGVIMNVLKEELPEDRKSRYWAFIIGALGYTVLLLFLHEAE